jgi:hypothetical protein
MPIRSHKMPRAYLQRFATSAKRGKGKLCVYERGRPPRLGTPKSESAERGFFTSKLSDGTYSDGPAERWAQKIEDRAILPLKHAANPCFVWTDVNRQRMAEYWALMFVRASAAFEFHRTLWERSLSEMHERIRSDAELRAQLMQRYSFLFGRPISEVELLGIYNRVIPSLRTEAEMRGHYIERLQYRTRLFSQILLGKTWQVWLAPSGCEFVTCDSPVMTLRFDNWGRYYVGDGFGRDGVTVLLPVSPNACLFAGLQPYPNRTIDQHDLYEINKVVISSSARFVYSKTWDDALDAVVQECGGSIRYGVDAFRGSMADEVLELLL